MYSLLLLLPVHVSLSVSYISMFTLSVQSVSM